MKLLKPNSKKSKAFTSSSLKTLKNAKISPTPKGISITALTIENTHFAESGKNPSIKLITKNIAKYAKVIEAVFPHFPANFLRASALKSDES